MSDKPTNRAFELPFTRLPTVHLYPHNMFELGDAILGLDPRLVRQLQGEHYSTNEHRT
jgi:hypothetical protein